MNYIYVYVFMCKEKNNKIILDKIIVCIMYKLFHVANNDNA